MFRFALIGVCVLGCAACTTAPTDPKSASATPAAVQTASDDNKLVCRDVSTTGSYGPRHECHSKAAWDKIDAQNY